MTFFLFSYDSFIFLNKERTTNTSYLMKRKFEEVLEEANVKTRKLRTELVREIQDKVYNKMIEKLEKFVTQEQDSFKERSKNFFIRTYVETPDNFETTDEEDKLFQKRLMENNEYDFSSYDISICDSGTKIIFDIKRDKF